MTTTTSTPSGDIDSGDLTAPLPDRGFRDAWDLNGTVIELDPVVLKNIISERVYQAMHDRIIDGITWQYNNADTPHPVKITNSMRSFLSDTQAAIEHPTLPRPNVHDGEIYQDGVSFVIDKDGVVELAVFAYAWGLKVSQKASQVLIPALDSMTVEQLTSYFDTPPDWSVTWEPADTANGWSDNTLTQLP